MISNRSVPVSRLLLMGTFFLFLALSFSLTGCESSEEPHSDIQLDLEIEPDPPAVGIAAITITLRDSTDQLITGADVELEANMSHPGMQPVFVSAEEFEPGIYSADVEFTMGGDWFFLVQSTLPDNNVIERQVNINGVRSQ